MKNLLDYLAVLAAAISMYLAIREPLKNKWLRILDVVAWLSFIPILFFFDWIFALIPWVARHRMQLHLSWQGFLTTLGIFILTFVSFGIVSSFIYKHGDNWFNPTKIKK